MVLEGSAFARSKDKNLARARKYVSSCSFASDGPFNLPRSNRVGSCQSGTTHTYSLINVRSRLHLGAELQSTGKTVGTVTECHDRLLKHLLRHIVQICIIFLRLIYFSALSNRSFQLPRNPILLSSNQVNFSFLLPNVLNFKYRESIYSVIKLILFILHVYLLFPFFFRCFKADCFSVGFVYFNLFPKE